ncbi:LAME_0F14136g1_1 [Lachancea meyersii CBS 8951]|uniref:LAME_0F14136g1_1 n=1 Tax=Lachancea meyersii CBS 8951 TaxID=1266667 RepID=A0A1G4JXZ8_9SACH|nr:LAME_0F14136g1_1 [Lachancea meyersii CBS 8951]
MFCRRALALYSPARLRVFQFLTIRSYAVISLRPYQQECIDKCVESINRGQKRIGVSLATGSGKTVIFSSLINQLRSASGHVKYRALVLVHRRELALQACKVLKTLFPHLDVQVEMGRAHCNIESADVIVASVQSLIRRLDRYDLKDIDLMIIDEAHHAAANSYQQILKHFGAADKTSPIPVIGFSATFERADNKALSSVMDEIVYHRGIIEMIDDKWLCEGRFTTVDVRLDLKDVSTTAGDFNLDGLSRVVNTREINKVVLHTYLQKKRDHKLKSTLLFGCDIKHIETLQELFQNNNINAQFVTAQTRQTERDSIVEDFKNGRIEVLMNCGIFTEGTDLPNVDSVFLCRPTRSRSLLVQMIGRGLRLHHTKDFCHIVDFVGASNVGVVSFPTLAGIDGTNVDLDEATMLDLEKIKEEMILKQREAELQQQKEHENELLIHQKFQELLKNSSAFDLTLTTFEDFLSFHKQTAMIGDQQALNYNSELGREMKYLRESTYPWVRFANDGWAMPLDMGHHLRIYKETGKTEAHTMYTLKLYTEFPYKVRQELGMRYKPQNVKKAHDLGVVAAAVDKIVQELKMSPEMSGKKYRKYAPWRLAPATPKQQALIKTKILNVLSKVGSKKAPVLSKSQIDIYLANLTKGEASNLLFATNLAPIYPIKALCRTVSYKFT